MGDVKFPLLGGSGLISADQVPDLSGSYVPQADVGATVVSQGQAAAPPTAAAVTQGLYQRTQPKPPTFNFTIRPLVKDPNTNGANGTGRIWVSDQAHDYIAYSDDDGATITLCGLNPDHTSTPSRSVQSLVITANYFWLSTAGPTTELPCSGRIWRAPYSATPGSLTWTLIWDMNGQALGTGGAASTGNANGSLRNASFAVSTDETVLAVGAYGAANASTTRSPASVTDGVMAQGSPFLYSATANFSASDVLGPSLTVAGAGAAGGTLTAKIVEILSPQQVRLASPALTGVTAATVTWTAATYGPGVVVGGPQIWVSANPTTASPLFTVARTFPMAKHCHAVRFINGVFWAAFGDLGHPFTDQTSYLNSATGNTVTDIGLWNTLTEAATSWAKVSVSGDPLGGKYFDPINFLPVTVAGQPGVLCESDSNLYAGPLWFGTQTKDVARALLPACELPFPYVGTMRSLGIDPATGNAYWLQTGESGGVGPLDTVVMAAAPYAVPVVLESAAANTTFTGSYGDAVISNGYFWIGTYRCRIEKIKGQ